MALRPETLPQYVYKIVEEAPPEPFPATFPPSELDKTDGFIHLSTSWQIPITSGLFFNDKSRIWVIKIRFKRFEADTKWEVPGTDGCPHLYGNFGAEDVESVEKFERKEGQSWEDAFKGSKWLE